MVNRKKCLTLDEIIGILELYLLDTMNQRQKKRIHESRQQVSLTIKPNKYALSTFRGAFCIYRNYQEAVRPCGCIFI